MIIDSNTRILYLGSHTYSKSKGTNEIFYGGGTEMMNEYVLSLLSRITHKIDYLVISGSSKLIRSEYVDHYNINYAERMYDKELLIDIINKNEYDLIVLNTYFIATPIASYINNIIGKLDTPILMFLHGKNCSDIKVISKTFIEKKNVYFIVATENEYESVKEKSTDSRVSKIDYPVNYSIDPSSITSNNIDNGVLVISRATPQKGILNDAKIAKILNTKLTIIGKTGNKSYTTELLHDIDELGVEYVHEGTKSRNELKNIIEKSAFLIHLPSSIEGCSLVIKESMILGTPVITWDDFSLKDNFPDGYCIALTHNDNFEEEFREKYLSKIDEYLTENHRRKISEYSNNRFSLKNFENNVLDIINSIENS